MRGREGEGEREGVREGERESTQTLLGQNYTPAELHISGLLYT